MNRDIIEIINDIENWSIPSKERLLDYVDGIKTNNQKNSNRRPVSETGFLWSINERINPLQMYLYLKARYGKPNGLAMAVINKDTSDNVMHWEFMVVSGLHMITFTGYTFHFNIMITNVSTKGEGDKDICINGLAKDFGRYRSQMDEIFKTLEPWFLFINPYFHYSDMINDLFVRLKATKLAKANKYSRPSTSAEFEALNDFSENLHEAFSLGTMLKVLVPIWIESYVNLIFVLMAKDEIKKDKHLFEEKKRQPIIKKIKNLHLDCYGFIDSVSEDEIKGIRSVFKSRNRYLHGSFDPRFNLSTTMYFDSKYTPLFNMNTYSPHLIKKLLLNEVNEDQLDKEITSGEEFILILFSKIHAKFSKDLIRLTNESFIGWEMKRNILGCVLPQQFPDMFFHDDQYVKKKNKKNI